MNHGLLAFLFGSVLIAVGFAGCLDGEPDSDSDPQGSNGEDAKGSWFADLSECRGTYPPEREVPIRCENEIQQLEPEPGNLTEGWECVDHAVERRGRNQVTLYWNEEQEHHAIFYNTSAKKDLSGILAVNQTGSVEYANWNHAHGNGTIALDALEPGTNLTLFTFVTIHSSDREELEEGSWRADWSLYNGSPYPVRVLETPSGEYIFQQARYRGDDHPVFPYHWAVSMTKEGEDYSIMVVPLELTDLQLSVPLPGAPSTC